MEKLDLSAIFQTTDAIVATDLLISKIKAKISYDFKTTIVRRS